MEGRVGFTADRRVHLSAFGDSAIWAVAVIGSGHVPHASPDLLRRRWLEHPLAMDAEPIPRQRHRRGAGLDSDAHRRQVARSSGMSQAEQKRGRPRQAASRTPMRCL